MELLYYYYVTKNWFIYKFGNYFSCNTKDETLLENLINEVNNDSNDSNDSTENIKDNMKLEPFEKIQK